MSNSHPHARVANGMDIARPDLTFFEVARRSSRSAVEHRIRLLVRLRIKQDSRVLRANPVHHPSHLIISGLRVVIAYYDVDASDRMSA